MKKTFIIFLLLLVSSCTKQIIKETPLNYSVMPKYLDIDSIQPIFSIDTSDILDSSFIDFKSMPIDSGTLYTIYGDSMVIPAGVLISERKAVLYVFYRDSYERYQKESKYAKYLMRTYYDKAKAAEILYQDEIKRLLEKSKRSWLEKNIGYIGFAAGLATAIITEFAVIKVSQ